MRHRGDIMSDRRNVAIGKHPTADCECGWQLWREVGFTKKQAFEAVKRHHRHDCELPIYRDIRSRLDAENV